MEKKSRLPRKEKKVVFQFIKALRLHGAKCYYDYNKKCTVIENFNRFNH